MGIAAVDGYGLITQSNAKEIYTAWKRGEVELSASQQKYTEHFLSDEELEEISYDSKSSYEEGKDQINTEGTENSAQGGNAAGCTAGNIASVVGTTLLAKVALAATGFTAVVLGVAAVACSAASLLFTKAFDGEYDNRTKAGEEAENTNATLDGYSDSLISTMDMMNEDTKEYQAKQDEYTLAANENVSTAASLQVELNNAEAAGDLQNAKQLRAQLKQVQNADMSGYQEGLDETSGKLEEYNSANSESMGVRDAGQSVSNFLKDGTALGVVGYVNSAILGVAGLAMSATALGHVPKIAPFFPDAVTSVAAKIMYGAAAALFATSCKTMSTKAGAEIDCGSKGNDMQEHVNDLTASLGEQSSYIDQTSENYTASDEEASENKDKAKEKADKAVKKNSPEPQLKKEENKNTNNNTNNNTSNGSTVAA